MYERKKLNVIDGTDALAYVLLLPGTEPGSIRVEAHANGISKERAAGVLRALAEQWGGTETGTVTHVGSHD